MAAAATASSLSFFNCANANANRQIYPPPSRLSLLHNNKNAPPLLQSSGRFSILRTQKRNLHLVASLPPPSPTPLSPTTRLFVSGLSFRTTEASLRNAFKIFGELLEVNLVMDNIAKRPKGFAFLRYATEEESWKAIEGMHGKFLDGRVIFVEVAKSRSELRKGLK